MRVFLLVKHLVFISVCVYFLFIAVLVTAQDSIDDPAIESIQIIADEGVTEKVVINLNGSYTPRVFRLNGDQPRLVLDFFDVRYLSGTHKIDGAGTSFVAGIRIGRHKNPSKTRIVVDIQKDTPYDYEQSFNVSNNILEISFSPGIPDDQKGAAQQHIQVGKAKIVHESVSVGDKQEAQQEKAESTDKDTGDPGSGIVESQSAETLPAEESKEEAPVVEAPDDQEVSKDSTEPVDKDSAAAVDKSDIAESDSEAQETSEGSMESEAQDPASTVDESTIAESDSEDLAMSEDSMEPEEKDPVAAVDTGSVAESDSDGRADPVPPVILGVSFEHSINNSETVLFKLSHFYPPLVFGIEKGEPRVVCDFLGAEIGTDVPSVIEADGKYVNRITISSLTEPDKIRIELELVPNQHYDLQQLFFKEDNLFVVIVNEFEEAPNAAN